MVAAGTAPWCCPCRYEPLGRSGARGCDPAAADQGQFVADPDLQVARQYAADDEFRRASGRLDTVALVLAQGHLPSDSLRAMIRRLNAELRSK